MNAGPGKSAVLFLDFYFIRVYCFNYCAFGRPGKIYLSTGKSWKSPGKLFLKKGAEPASCCFLRQETLPHIVSVHPGV